MKKYGILAFILAIVLMFSLTACGSKDDNGGQQAENGSESGSTAGPEDGTSDPGENDAGSENNADQEGTSDDQGGSGSTEGTKAQEIWEAIAGAVELPSTMELTPQDLENTYGISQDQYEEFVCQYPLMNVTATEILIIKPAEGQEDAVKQAIEARQKALEEQWSMYLPAQLELVENYKLAEAGGYILFCVAEDSEGVVNAFSSAAEQ